MKLLQIVGFSNSGKTTLIEKALQYMVEKGLSVATIKHHGHGKKLLALDTGKDSHRYREAGAVGSAVAASETLQLQVQKKEPWSAEEILSIYEKLDLDGVLIEGFKQEPFPKIAMIRHTEDLTMFEGMENLQAVIYWEAIDGLEKKGISFFHIKEEQAYLEWMYQQLEAKHE